MSDRLTEEAAQALSDDELADAVESNVWNAAFYRVHTVFDDNCTVLWREANRRGDESLYTKGYKRAERAALG